MAWSKAGIVQKLRALHKSGRDLSYNAMCRRFQAVLSAAAYHFDSYRAAVEEAGIDYAEVTRRPRWTRPATGGNQRVRLILYSERVVGNARPFDL